MINISQVRELHIELTTRCNAHCPQCPRNYRGYDFNSGYPTTELSLSDIKQIFSPEFLKQIRVVNLNGNLGDFGLATQGPEIVQYLISAGIPQVVINTNASMRTTDWWSKLAIPGVKIHFGIDGLADTHTLYRQGTDWHKILANAQAFIQAGGYAVWQFIPFEFNQHQQAQCQVMATEMDFKKFLVIDQGRNTGPVYTRKGKFSHWLSTETTQAPPVGELVEHHLTWFDSRTYQHELDQMPLRTNCLTKNLKSIYVSANGGVYPCCYLGFYPDQMQMPGNDQTAKIVSENNALIYGL